MAGVIYGLCSLAAILCSALLLLGYLRSRYRLLLWGSLCFVGLTVNNFLVIADELVVQSIDLGTWRLAAALGGMMILLYGLIWDTE
jgi:hypothetical protein